MQVEAGQVWRSPLVDKAVFTVLDPVGDGRWWCDLGGGVQVMFDEDFILDAYLQVG